MANIRVKDLPNTNAANDNDEFIVDSSTSGTRRISYSELKSEISTDFAADVATYGIATLDSDNKLTASQIPDSLAQGMNFVGVANSAGDLTSTTQGDFYVIQTAFGVYSVGDQAVYDGSAYVRVVDGTKEISEGGTGATTLDAAKTNLEIINIGSAANQVSLNSMLGDLAFQSSDGVSMARAEVESTTGTATTQALTVTDGSSTNFVVQEDGRVGIGTSSPSSYSGANADELVVETSGHTGLTIRSGSTSNGAIHFASATTGNELYRGYVAYSHQYDILTFGASGQGRWSINSLGNLVAGSGLGIDFGSAATSAGQGTGTTGTPANSVLSDYEYGSWTPTIAPSGGSFTSITMDVQSATYVKVGRMVHCQAYIRTDGLDTTGASGSVRVTGLPFVNSGSSNYAAVSVGLSRNWVTNPAGGYVNNGVASLTLTKRTTSSTELIEMEPADMTTGSGTDKNAVLMSFQYIAST